MTRLTPAASTIPLVTGVATATVLSAAAVFTVLHAGCEHPGAYRFDGGPSNRGVVELVGSCITPEDIPVAPGTGPAPDPRPLGEAVRP